MEFAKIVQLVIKTRFFYRRIKLKKILFLIAILSSSLFLSCKAKKMDTSDRVNIVCTIFPEYDWVRNIIDTEGDTKTTVTLLVKNGVDLHSYQPSATDMITLKNCDVLMFVGGESDKWIYDAIENPTNQNMIKINLMEVLKNHIKEEEIVEGMQIENKDSNSKTEKELEYDEHVWLSIKNAKIICEYFTKTLISLIPENAGEYQTRYEEYLKKLDAMDLSFNAITREVQNKTLVFCDRFPFRYLLDDYDLKYFAAFAGCSAETEASFETIAFLAKKLNELDLNAVIVLENSDKKIAKTVIGNAKRPKCDILTMNSMQSVTLRQAFAGVSYISEMQKNLETIQTALKVVDETSTK